MNRARQGDDRTNLAADLYPIATSYSRFKISEFLNKTFVNRMRNELSEVKIKYDKSLMQYDTVMNELDNQTITDLSERIEETFTKMKNCRHLDNDIKSKTKHVSDLKASYKKTLAKVIKRRDQIYEECSNLQMTNLEEYDDNFMYYEAESFEPYLLNAQAKFVTQFNACIKPFIRCLKI